MVIICTSCHGQMDAPQSALNKKVRCPICSEIFVAALPKAEVIEDEHVEPDKPSQPKEPTEPEEPRKPDEPTASGDLPIVLSAKPGPAPSAESEGVDPSDPLGQLAAAGLKPGRRRKAATGAGKAAARGKRGDTARKALASFATAPQPKVHWPGGKAEPAPKRGRSRAPTRYRRTSKDVWYVIAGDYEYGPYKPQVILSAIRSGKISRGILMRHALTDSVISAGRILELLPKQQRPGASQPAARAAGRKGGKSAASPVKSPAAEAASSALDSMAGGPSKAKHRGKGKKKQPPGE